MSLEAASFSHAVQVIDEDKQFQQESINNYVKDVIKIDLGLHYHVISVFGSQSTGKSTLLNQLFNTKFDVMDETQRQQTTKGIWLSYTSTIASTVESTDFQKILVMDVEGTDGRERGEDQDFERKAALFALSTSEVLIVNIWEHQVGLYQGANMGLLKTVFEVNLSLFGNQKHRVLLLFVIRDFIGNTPLDNLSKTLIQDLTKMWEGISKPSNVPEDVKLSDYFDLQFTALAHKFLQPAEFDLNIKQLGDKFIDPGNPEHLFKADHLQNFPIDGWTLYAKNCWEQIQSNKDLDLPTQQILVARFRCDEIAKESFTLFEESFLEDFNDTKLESFSGEEVACIFAKLIDLVSKNYDSHASHYNREVYKTRRESLLNEVSTKLKSVYLEFVDKFTKSLFIKFKEAFTDKSNKASFLDKSKFIQERIVNDFKEGLEPFIAINSKEFAYGSKLKHFESELELEIASLREIETENLVFRILKKVVPLIKNQTFELFAEPNSELWDKVLENLESHLDFALTKYKTQKEGCFDFKLGGPDDINEKTAEKIRKAVWISFDQFIHEYLREDNVVNILRRQFENTFSYDSNNVPRTWKNEHEISQVYQSAVAETLKALPIFAVAQLSNGTEIVPEHEGQEDLDSDDEDQPRKFSEILTGSEQKKIKDQFLKAAELSYRDANRSIINNIAKIPPFMFVLLIVLGWNEFMAILRNPIYLVFTILIGTGVFFIHQLNLWGPVNQATNIFIQQGKDWLADMLLDGNQHSHRPPSTKYSNSESIELSDLSEKSYYEKKE